MGQSTPHRKAKHSPGHLVGNYQDSNRHHETRDAEDHRAPGHLVGNFQDSHAGDGADDENQRHSHEAKALGRPDLNEDKDANVEQARSKGVAGAHDAMPRQPRKQQSAERVDPGRRAGERH